MAANKKILILGATGLVGKALVREYRQHTQLTVLAPPRSECDLLNQQSTLGYFDKHRPEQVIVAAAKVGGIFANNTYSGDFILQNLSMVNHVFEAAHLRPPERLLFLGSSCIYPKAAPSPIKEEYLLTGPLEPTNEAYAIAKIAGLKLAEHLRKQYKHDFISAMPTNLYGIGDNYDPMNSHVIPGLIARLQKIIEEGAPTFEVWGSGKPRREFLYVDDLARACRLIMETNGVLPDLINIGCGEDVTIGELAELLCELMNFSGTIIYNTEKPDGTLRKLLDVTKIFSLGWRPEISLRVGLQRAIEEYRHLSARK